MTWRIIVLGGGTGGTLLVSRLGRQLDRAVAEIVVVGADDEHVYQPGLLFVPFGLLARPEALVRPRQHQLRSGVGFHCSAVD